MANLKDLIVSGSARILGNVYGTLKGNADTATKLETPRTIRTNLGSTSAVGFDGTTNITPGIQGTLGVANGGTGQTSVANIQAGKDADGNVISTTYAKNSDLNSYVPNTRTVNGKALSSNITLTASDVSALSSSTGIKDLTTTAQQNALNSGITSSLVTQIGTNKSNISTLQSTKADDSAVVKLTGNQNITGTKTFNAEIKGTLITYQCHNGETGGFYRKMGEVVLTGPYRSVVVPFYYYKDSTNCTETGYTGKISLRVDGTAGVVGATNTGVVLGEYPDWINDGRAAFYILYKNNTPETNKATLEVWTYVKNAWDGFKIIPLSYHGYGQSGWTWYNNPNGVTELPSGYTVINQKFARMYITTPTDTTTTTGKQIATTGWVNTRLGNYQLKATYDSTNEMLVLS